MDAPIRMVSFLREDWIVAALDDDQIRQFTSWVRTEFQVPGLHRSETVLLKNGPQKYKTASLLYFGRSAEDISKVELRLRTSALVDGEFIADRQWSCEDVEIEALRSFLQSEFGDAGEYRVVTGAATTDQVLSFLADRTMPAGFLAAVACALADRIGSVDDLIELDGAEVVGQALELRRQRAVADEFERLILDSSSTEQDLQTIIAANWWLLGANYIGKLDRRNLTALDQYDLLLLRVDGVAHVVELKKAFVPRVVRTHRAHCSVGSEVNLAVNQAMNYLRALDEQAHTIFAEFGVKCRRAQATVIIGHPQHNGQADVTAAQFHEAIRTFNGHLSRIEVLSYADVLATATNSIAALTRQIEAEAARGTAWSGG